MAEGNLTVKRPEVWLLIDSIASSGKLDKVHSICPVSFLLLIYEPKNHPQLQDPAAVFFCKIISSTAVMSNAKPLLQNLLLQGFNEDNLNVVYTFL